MPEKTKQQEDSTKQAADENVSADSCETEKKGNWSEDQQEKSYYYDDSHGYEIYNPDDDDDDE